MYRARREFWQSNQTMYRWIYVMGPWGPAQPNQFRVNCLQRCGPSRLIRFRTAQRGTVRRFKGDFNSQNDSSRCTSCHQWSCAILLLFISLHGESQLRPYPTANRTTHTVLDPRTSRLIPASCLSRHTGGISVSNPPTFVHALQLRYATCGSSSPAFSFRVQYRTACFTAQCRLSHLIPRCTRTNGHGAKA